MARVAIIHDWLTGLRGGEKCLLSFLKLYPEADIYSLIHIPGTTTPEIDKNVKATSFLQKFPLVKNYYRLLLPLYPSAVKGFKLQGYDLVISLSHAAAKNVDVPEGTKHVSYCFTPMRYIWDQAETYFGNFTPLISPLIRNLRKWDSEHAQKVDHFIAISRFVAARIRCYYQKRADVIYPSVETNWIKPISSYYPGKAFLYAGALVPYKKVDLLVDVFNDLGYEFWIAGKGPEERKLRKKAKSNIKFFIDVDDLKLAELYAECRALLSPATEDFGMIPIECLAAGRPVIGMYDGALKETLNAVRPWIYSGAASSYLALEDSCGVFIEKDKSNPAGSIKESIEFFMRYETEFQPAVCKKQAEVFSPIRFYSTWANFILKNNIFPKKEEMPPVSEEICQHA